MTVAIRPLSLVQREAILSALDECHGNRKLAAHRLGIGKTTIYRLLKNWGFKKGTKWNYSSSRGWSVESSKVEPVLLKIPVTADELAIAGVKCPRCGERLIL
jgi:hypothetical protein